MILVFYSYYCYYSRFFYFSEWLQLMNVIQIIAVAFRLLKMLISTVLWWNTSNITIIICTCLSLYTQFRSCFKNHMLLIIIYLFSTQYYSICITCWNAKWALLYNIIQLGLSLSYEFPLIFIFLEVELDGYPLIYYSL